MLLLNGSNRYSIRLLWRKKGGVDNTQYGVDSTQFGVDSTQFGVDGTQFRVGVDGTPLGVVFDRESNLGPLGSTPGPMGRSRTAYVFNFMLLWQTAAGGGGLRLSLNP